MRIGLLLSFVLILTGCGGGTEEVGAEGVDQHVSPELDQDAADTVASLIMNRRA